jgi:hypothetical protein
LDKYFLAFKMSEIIQRNNTNFPSQIAKLLENYMLTGHEYDKLFYYQQWARYYFEKKITKGFTIEHTMGSGKTKTGLSIIDTAIKMGITKIIYVAPKSLAGSLDREVAEYNKLMNAELSTSQFSFIARSYTVVKNISKRETNEDFTLDSSSISRNIKQISDNGLVIIDEAHLIMQSISNGSPGMVEFYDLLMNSPNVRIIMMTGTITNSRPFELAPMFNISSGERIFPETEKAFMDAFWDRENKVMHNRAKFQNRIMGLVSSIDQDAIQLEIGENNRLRRRIATSPIDKSDKSDKSNGKVSMYPELHETQVLQVPMAGRQIGVYMIRREKELKEEMSKKSITTNTNYQKFSRADKESSTYMVRTRQCSNYAPPPAIEVLYNSDSGYDAKDIAEVMNQATPEELESPKFILIDQIIRHHKNQKGIIYSQFTDIGGNGAFARYLQTPERTIESNANLQNDPMKLNKYKCCGYEMLKLDSELKPTNLGPKTFAMLNGSVSESHYNVILEIYNRPENDHGELLPFLLIGTREGLGLDLKCCRYVVKMEVYFIYSFYSQLLARARRYASHLRLDPMERDVQPYILLATYPPKFVVGDYIQAQKETRSLLTDQQMMSGLAETTDEKMYRIMLNNLQTNKPFVDAVHEVSIECNVLKRYIPDKVCRMCAPNDMKLYTDLIKGQSPEKLLNYDLREEDPCQDYETEQIEATKVTIKTADGDIDYFYVNDPISANGFSIYYFDKSKGVYEELFASSPAYHLVLSKIAGK